MEQIKVQYNLDEETDKISILSSRNENEYEFLTREDALPYKGLLDKAATIKRFEYPLLSSELKQ